LVGPGGAVLATTGAFSAKAGEVVQLVPVVPTTSRMGGSSTWETSTSVIVGAAAGSGILAYSPGRRVTPQ
jgi:hypothetical protein